MNKLDSMWYHESPGNGRLASSHIAIVFCALVKNGMVADDLLEMVFEGIPNNFNDKSLSPMDYCLAYTDGEIFDIYIKPKCRKVISGLFDSNQIFEIIFAIEGLEHDRENETYTLKSNWHNVDILADWLELQFPED